MSLVVQEIYGWLLGHYAIPFFFSRLIQDILAEQIPPRKGRHNPRVVKKPCSKFPAKKPLHREMSSQPKQLTFSSFNSA